MNKKNIYFIVLCIIFLSRCKKNEAEPAPITLSDSMIDLGTFNLNTKTLIKLIKNNSGSVTYSVSGNKKWLVIDKSSGSLVTSEVLNLSISSDLSDLVEGNNTATVTIIPTVDGKLGNPIIATIKGNYILPKTGTISNHTISGVESWADNIYLNGSVTVPLGSTLIIYPGTIINSIKNTKIEVLGKLIAKGTINKIISFSNVSSQWDGINVTNDGGIEMRYVYISNAQIAINFNTPSSNYLHLIDYVYFKDNVDAINGLQSNMALKFSNLSFKNINFSAIETNTLSFNLNLSLENIDFENSGSFADDIKFSGQSGNLAISNSNFGLKSVGTNIKSSLNILATHCYGLKSVPSGANYQVSNAATTKNLNIGCGFTDKYP